MTLVWAGASGVEFAGVCAGVNVVKRRTAAERRERLKRDMLESVSPVDVVKRDREDRFEQLSFLGKL